MTDEFKKHFRRSYGWARQAPDYRRCASWVAFDMKRHGKEQCPNQNGHGTDGAFCKTHATRFGMTPTAPVNRRNM